MKRHMSNVSKIDSAKKALQHRNSFTASAQKKPIVNVDERRATIIGSKVKKTSADYS